MRLRAQADRAGHLGVLALGVGDGALGIAAGHQNAVAVVFGVVHLMQFRAAGAGEVAYLPGAELRRDAPVADDGVGCLGELGFGYVRKQLRG